ncbi:hypothetical protein [Ruminococcus sp.]|uniref:DUF7832 domain-containing protein n=1 Tax=Ruminococcus sp. TaxID=41978 RepID=UPI0025FF513A|nr:hypothetical protein [Ruminococcus sp.]MBQ8966640.1 hypothetical protein [Ruminococcus sp.]
MKNFVRKLGYVMYTILAVVEMLAVVVFIGATIDPTEGNDPLFTIPDMIAASSCAGILMLISFGSIARLHMDKKMVFVCGLLMRLFVLGGGAAWFFYSSYHVSSPEAAAVTLFITLIFGVAAYIMGRQSDKRSDHSPGNANSSFIADNFDVEKAEWCFDAAAEEYYGRDVPPMISEKDSDRIYGYAARPMASYLGWLVSRGLVTEGFCQGIDPVLLQDVRDGRADPLLLLEQNDLTLTSDMIDKQAGWFTNNYYWDCMHRTRWWFYAFDLDSTSYQFDYFDIIGCGQNYYVNDFDPRRQEELNKLLDRRFREYDKEGRYDYELYKTVDSKIFGEAEILADEDISESYLDMICDMIADPSAELEDSLFAAIQDFAENCGTHYADKQEAFAAFSEPSVYVSRPEGEEPAFVIEGGGELEPEHGCGMTVRGRYVSNLTYAGEEDEPWTEAVRLSMKMEDMDREPLRQAFVIPYECGGSQTADNMVSLPETLAEAKEKCDRRIICLLKQGMKLSYVFEPYYNSAGRAAGMKVEALRTDGRKAFSMISRAIGS